LPAADSGGTLCASETPSDLTSWGNYHWARTANPFTLKLDNNVTSTWTTYLNQASSDWTAPT
jgi:hypothetical protein